MNKFLYFTFLLILGLASFLRIFQLDKNPAGFFCDEASIGYNAYSILKTGKDEYQNPFPIFFPSFGDYKNPVLIYSTVPFVWLFGLSEFGVRIVPAIYGIFSVVLIFFLSKKLFNEHVALFSALFLAISPWHVHLSRVALEGIIVFPFFFTLGTYFFLEGKKRPAFLVLSFIFFGISLYTYYPAYLISPLFLLFLLFLNFSEVKDKLNFLLIGFFIFYLISLPLLFHILSGKGLARFKQTTFLESFSQIFEIQTLKRIFKLYTQHFSFIFLFQKGDSGFPGQFITRHSIIGIGQLYLIQFLFLLFGIVFLIWKKKTEEILMLGFWLLVYPLGTVFTNAPGPQATRSIIGVIPFQILSGLGLYCLLEIGKKIFKKFYIIFGSIFFLAITLSFLNFWELFLQYPLYSSDFWGWQYGPREIISYFKKVEKDYDELIMSSQFNQPEFFLKFYSPGACQKCKIGNLDSFDPFKRQLFALSPGEWIKSPFFAKKIIYHTIFYPDGKVAFLIAEIKI
mgnify:CR=1 FL=1